PGCVQQVIAPEIDEAVARLLVRRGISLVPLRGAGCCGALAHHLGREAEAKAWAKRLIAAFENAGGADAFEGIFISASGCAAHIHEHEYLFLDKPEWQARAQAFAEKLVQLPQLISSNPPLEGGSKNSERSGGFFGEGPTMRDSSPLPEICSLAFANFDPPSRGGLEKSPIRVALQVPCSQQHGLRGDDGGDVLRAAGFEVAHIPEEHLCCGSAGSYSILQPEIATALRERKLTNIRSVQPDIIATSNIGCLQHLGGPDAPPVVHIAELLDWAEGGAVPKALAARRQLMANGEGPG
ncbi:MAG TPA: heterodisulfide reductase-related iron-sulfur binding cluster, partial [Rhizomicrobium sp.]|nr:heterodisulfide reductase-related iron-sulfur binding cluster [Rhizomicrobium sp.]